jgi:VanZ family protein
MSLNPWLRPETMASAFSPDKLGHALGYGVLVVLVYYFLVNIGGRFRNCSPCAWSAALAIAVCFGILVEIAQGLFTTSRTPSVADAVANACGALAGYLGFHAVKFLFNRR